MFTDGASCDFSLGEACRRAMVRNGMGRRSACSGLPAMSNCCCQPGRAGGPPSLARIAFDPKCPRNLYVLICTYSDSFRMGRKQEPAEPAQAWRRLSHRPVDLRRSAVRNFHRTNNGRWRATLAWNRIHRRSDRFGRRAHVPRSRLGRNRANHFSQTGISTRKEVV